MKKFIFGFLLGGIAAGVPAYFITKKIVEDRCQQEVNELKDYYKNKYEKSCEEEADRDSEISTAEEEAIKNHVNKVPDKPIPPSYKKIADKYKSEDAPDEYYDEEDMADADAEYPPEDRPDVEIISQEEYDEINHEFEHSCLIYYVNDMQLATEEGQIIDNEKYLIEDALDIDGWRNNDEMVDNIYVRNNKISEMFEIAKCIGAYGDLN